MKRIIHICLIILVCISCNTKYFFESYNSQLIHVKDSIQSKPFNNTNIYEDERMKIIFSQSLSQICFSITNKSEKPLIINWDKISYINRGGYSYKIIHSGVKFTEKDLPQLKSFVSPNVTLADTLILANNIYYSNEDSGKWNIRSIFPYYTKDTSTRNLWLNTYLGSNYSIHFPISWEDGVNKDFIFDFIINKICIVQKNPNRTYYMTLQNTYLGNKNHQYQSDTY